MLSSFRHTLVLLWLMVAAIAIVASPSARAEDDPATVTARQRFQEGVRQFDAGQYAKARVSFVQAYALRQHPSVLLNLAQSELRTPGHEAIAAQHFAEYLRMGSEANKRSEAEAGLAAAKEKIGTVKVTSDRAGAKVLVDGEQYGVTPLEDPLYLKPGSYTIEARFGEDTRSESVAARAGAEASVELAFESAAEEEPGAVTAPEEATAAAAAAEQPPKRERKEAQPAKAEPSEEAAPGRREKFPRWFVHKPLAIVLGVVALGGVGAGVGLQLVAMNEHDDADNIEAAILYQAEADRLTVLDTGQMPCGDWVSIPPVQAYPGDTRYYDACTAYVEADGRGDDFTFASYFAFGGGALAAAGLVTYYFVDTKPNRGSERANTVRVTPWLGGGATGVVVGGRF